VAGQPGAAILYPSQLVPFTDLLGLRQHQPRLVGISCHEVDAGDLLPMDAAQRLAVKGQRLVWLSPLGDKPLAQHALKGGVVEPAKRAVQRRHTRSPLGP
jgi:hypothetical protein